MDTRVVGKGEAMPIVRRAVTVPDDTLVAPGPMWNYAWSTPLGPSPAADAVTVEIECVVDTGSVGFALWLEGEDRMISREVIVEARTGSQSLCLSTTAYEHPKHGC